MSINEKTKTLFTKVRDIPYGDIHSRNPEDVYVKNKGTCSGKHELLKELYSEIGLKVRDFIAMHSFNDLKVDFPPDIKEILNNTRIHDPHNFIKILVNGRWVTIDATWDKPLKRFGFMVNEGWDGKSDMKLCVVSTKIFETKNPMESKNQIIAGMPHDMQETRKLFLKKLSEWMDTIRQE